MAEVQECPHCFSDDLGHHAFGSYCNRCHAAMHRGALYNLHYFGNGEVHRRPDLDEACEGERPDTNADEDDNVV